MNSSDINSSTKKIADAEEKTNENNVDSQEQIRQLTSNENMIGYCQLTMQNLIVTKKKTTLQKVVFIKKDKDNMLYSVAKTDNTISIHLLP